LQQTGLSSTVTQADLSVTGLTSGTGTQVYNATTVANLGGTATVTPLSNDVVTVGGTAAGAFANKNVGTSKQITVSGITISGTDAGNYNLLQQTGLTASISTKTLTYTANSVIYTVNAVVTLFGTTSPALNGGAITGFVNGDDLANTTTGTLAFTTTASATSPVGRYAIDGGGLILNSGNYVFVQASSNATALTITSLKPFSNQKSQETSDVVTPDMEIGQVPSTRIEPTKPSQSINGSTVKPPELKATGVVPQVCVLDEYGELWCS